MFEPHEAFVVMLVRLRQQEADATLRKARALKAQRSEDYQKAHTSTSRSQEEPSSVANKQLEKKRRLVEEALQRVGRGRNYSQSAMHLFSARRVTRPHSLTVICCKLPMPSPTLTGVVCIASLPPGRGGPGALPELCGWRRRQEDGPGQRQEHYPHADSWDGLPVWSHTQGCELAAMTADF